MRHAIFLSLLITLAPSIVFAAEAKVPNGYELQNISGFTILVPNNLPRFPIDRWQRTPLQVLEQDLDDLRRVIGPKFLPMATSVPIWINWNAQDPKAPGIVAAYYGETSKALERFGQNPLKTNCIEIFSLKRLSEIRQPGSKFQQVVTLHEMAHAIHHRLLGFDAVEVNSAFQQAVERKLYDEVSDRFGRRCRAYARVSGPEYFAELSCAYLDSCHFYPFTYADLKEHDPVGFALMESVWKRPEQFADRNIQVSAARFGSPAVVKTYALPTVAAHQAAYGSIDRARAHVREGRHDKAKELLNAVVKNFPSTLAAADARELLAALR